MKLFSYIRTTGLLVLVLLFISCNKNRNTWLNRKYQNTVARFNYLYNGNEKLKEIKENLTLNHKDDYTKILEVFPYGDEAQAKAQAGAMDEVIKKASKIIVDKPLAKWVDDSHLLLGKAYLFKADYFAAQDAFAYIMARFGKLPIATEAQVWSLFAYDRSGKLKEAESGLMEFINAGEDQKLEKNTKAFYHGVAADIFIKKNRPQMAKEQLKLAIKNTGRKKDKARLYFILAQLFQREKQPDSVKIYLKRSVRSNPSFEMAFQAKLAIASAYTPGDKASMKESRRYLRSMLKEEKNATYFDQIYYYLGNIDQADNNTPGALDNYLKSTQKSTENLNQKGMSFLALAEIYFAMPDYKLAQAYFDSTVQFIQPNHPDYVNISRKQAVLSELITYRITYHKEDSLLQLSKLSKEALDKIVDRWIQEDKEKAKQKRQDAIKNKDDGNNNPLNDPNKFKNAVSGSGSGWYFYNPVAVTMGVTEFNKKWGSRKLTDYWRYSQLVKSGIGMDIVGDTSHAGNDKDDEIKDSDPDRQKYLQDIPFKEEDKRAADEKIKNALLHIGSIYYENLKYYPDAITYYNKFLEHYPGSKEEPEVLYKLYKIYSDRKDSKNTDKYKNELYTKYPNSDYRRVIDNVANPANLKAPKEKEDFYAGIYSLFREKKYDSIIAVRGQAVKELTGTYLLPKYELIYVMSIGAIKGAEVYKKELGMLIEQYPGTDEARAAMAILETMKKVIAAGDTTNKGRDRAYNYKPDDSHYVMIVVPSGGRVNISKIKERLSEYNNANFRLDTFTLRSEVLDRSYQFVLIESFKNKEAAIKYAKQLEMTQNVFAEFPFKEFKYFAITEENREQLIKQRLLDSYQQFYSKYYENK